MKFEYSDADNTTVACFGFDDDHIESHSIESDFIRAWISDGNEPMPYRPDEAEIRSRLAVDAQKALERSDVTALRCLELGIAVPGEWVEFRATLREIAGGNSDATELPERPVYPENT